MELSVSPLAELLSWNIHKKVFQMRGKNWENHFMKLNSFQIAILQNNK